jgi:hypothetical protein
MPQMPKNRRKQRGASAIEFALLTVVWLPLVLGVLAFGVNMIIGLQVIQVARDAAKLYALGTPFQDGNTSNQQLLSRLSKELGGLDTSGAHGGTGTLIFSAITYIGRNQCAAQGFADASTPPNPTAACTNYTHFVFQERFIVGNNTIRASNFGAPDTSLLNSNGQISTADQVTKTLARADSFTALPKPNEDGNDGFQAGSTAYMVEGAFNGVDFPGVVTGLKAYSFAIF